MRVLVCGGRDFNNPGLLEFGLDCLHSLYDFTVVIHGDSRGADRMAGQWALANGLIEEKYPADWKKYDEAAGPIRNRQMLKLGRPEMVVAFPGGDGTKHMVSLAKEAGLIVMDVW